MGERVAAELGVSLAAHEERVFEDGEGKTRPLESVGGRDVFVLSALHGSAAGSPHDKLVRLLFFLGALRDAGAATVTPVAPYLCYARKDRRTKARDPIATRYVAALFEAMGIGRLVALDVHNLAAFENAFRCPTVHLEARGLFVERLLREAAGAPLAVISPDAGGTQRADALRRDLAAATGSEPTLGLVAKRRSEGVVSDEALFGDVDGRMAVIVDDLVASGGTLVRAARRCRENGASRVWAMATHGVLAGGAPGLWTEPALERVVITDSIPRGEGELPASDKLEVLGIAPLLAGAIARLHGGD